MAAFYNVMFRIRPFTCRRVGQRVSRRRIVRLGADIDLLDKRWISSIIAGQSKYDVDDGISGACDEPPDNVDINSHLRTQHR
jgi:hypothetical protein